MKTETAKLEIKQQINQSNKKVWNDKKETTWNGMKSTLTKIKGMKEAICNQIWSRIKYNELNWTELNYLQKNE